MSTQVTVIDYGIGNLFSVQRALEHVGARVTLASEPADVEGAERLLLPGVGAFENGMRGLRERGLIEPIRRHAATGRPLLGICLGMQMLSGISEEFGVHEGLNLIPGRVRALPPLDGHGREQKIPAIGWAELLAPQGVGWATTPLAPLQPGSSSVYLVHSYEVIPDDAADRLAEYEYGGRRVCAAIRRGNVFGFQFHPEKSGAVGLQVLSSFLS